MDQTNSDVTAIFTKVSHHRSVTVLYMTQNLFFKNKELRTITLNAHYLVLFKNIRDVGQVGVLARQMYAGKSKLLIEVFKAATSVPFGYLLIDMRPETLDDYRLRTRIFPGERQEVFVPK
mgnify:FL=1